MGGGAGGEGAQDDVRDALGGEHVAAYDCGAGGGGEEGVRRYVHCDGGEAALVEGDGGGDEAAEAVDDGGVGDGLWGVGVAVHLRSCACEVEGCFAFCGVDGYAELDGAAVVHVVCCCQILS